MYKKYKHQAITLLLLLPIFTLACVSLQVGIVAPTTEDDSISIDDTQEDSYSLKSTCKLDRTSF